MSSCGRVVESLQYYDLVSPKEYPNFPQWLMLLVHRKLFWLKSLRWNFYQEPWSIRLKLGYEIASKADFKTYNVPEWLAEVWKKEYAFKM